MKKIFLLLIISLAFSCSNQEKNLPNNFDFGKTENGLYQNKYFDMEVSFNPNWIMQDKKGMNDLLERGKILMASENKEMESVIKASMVNTAYLLSIFKYEFGSAVEFNPSFMIIAENINKIPGIKRGKDYLFHAQQQLDKSPLPYTFEKEIYEKKIGKSSFDVLTCHLEYNNQSIIQEYLTTLSNGFSLSFILSYSTEQEKDELYELINNIKM